METENKTEVAIQTEAQIKEQELQKAKELIAIEEQKEHQAIADEVIAFVKSIEARGYTLHAKFSGIGNTCNSQIAVIKIK